MVKSLSDSRQSHLDVWEHFYRLPKGEYVMRFVQERSYFMTTAPRKRSHGRLANVAFRWKLPSEDEEYNHVKHA